MKNNQLIPKIRFKKSFVKSQKNEFKIDKKLIST